MFPDGEALPLMVSLLVAGDARRIVSVLCTSVFLSAGLAVTTPDLSEAGLFLTGEASVLVLAEVFPEARLSVDWICLSEDLPTDSLLLSGASVLVLLPDTLPAFSVGEYLAEEEADLLP